MIAPDFYQARRYAFKRLQSELSSEMFYHSLRHTVDEVVPAAERIATAEGVQGEDLHLLCTAAYFHDLGFVVQYPDHEQASVCIAEEVLPGYGYTAEQVARIQAMIMATRLPQSPVNLLEQILADADLEVLSREDYLKRNHDLRAELEARGVTYPDKKWYADQLRFIQQHQYFTPSARLYQAEIKRTNTEEMACLLKTSQEKASSASG